MALPPALHTWDILPLEVKGQDVVVSERDLAEELRMHPDAVAKALNIALGEH